MKKNVKELFKIKKAKDESKKFTKLEMILCLIISLLIGLIIGAVFLSKTSIITKNIIYKNKHVRELVENYEYITNNYYKEIDEQELVNSAISGMMDSLEDPYSLYLDDSSSSNLSITLDGSYKGIGVQILKEEKTGYMLIAAVLKNSSASDAGLRIGDLIVSVDGKDLTKMTSAEFSEYVQNSDKKQYNLVVIRDEKEFSVTLTKKKITLNSVSSEIIEREGKKIGYIYIGIFANNTYFQFKDQLDVLEKAKIDALIIDVRDNTGGHLTSVDSILDIFLTSKQKLYGFEKNGKVSYTYGTGDKVKDYEIVLLGNSVSASASEVLIAGLKENLNSKYFGEKTYGKGTVQELVTLTDGTQYKMTIKKWLTPKGNWINDTEGIVPDKEVLLDDKYYETFKLEDDSQVEYAIEYILGR